MPTTIGVPREVKTGETRVALTPEGNYVVYQNRCDHLPAEMVTY